MLVRSPLALDMQGYRGGDSRIRGTLMQSEMTSHATHSQHDHWHAANCGHQAVKHEGHDDYEHDGHRHAEHAGHWDEHQPANAS